jgi:hypothetical protein
VSTIPKQLSEGEETFMLHCRAEGLAPEREVPFAAGRQWRFDFAFPANMLAVEIEGLSSGISRHATFKGYRGDCRKYAEAAILGWRVIRVTTEMVTSGEAIDYVLRALGKEPRC